MIPRKNDAEQPGAWIMMFRIFETVISMFVGVYNMIEMISESVFGTKSDRSLAVREKVPQEL